MNIEFDVTLQCNFSCLNCNRHSNFNNLKAHSSKETDVGLGLYENTDVDLHAVDNFIKDIKGNGDVDRIHLIGGEPLSHPKMDKIVTKIRDEIYGNHVEDILIISNIHPKMLKANTLDSPEEIVKYFPWDKFDKINLEHISAVSRYIMQVINHTMKEDGVTKEYVITNMDKLELNISGQTGSLKSFMSGKYKLERGGERYYCSFFYGIPVINYKPLSDKAEEHRCTLVAPIDSGQEILETCNIPNHCGINYSFDGYWPCSQGAAIARLFGLDKYKRDSLPKDTSEWDGIDNKGNATIESDGMWDLCKLCQLSAKKQMNESDFGRPISISYRKAMGMTGDKPKASFVEDSHKKKLKQVPIRNRK
jgi:organic radical activating enzyme